MTKLNNNPFYDFITAWSGKPIPSTRTGYKILNDGQGIPNPDSKSVQGFREAIRTAFARQPEFIRPYEGRILISLAIGLSKKDYSNKDLDNMVKSLIDALKTVVYVDDKQVDVLHVVKYESELEVWNIGIKKLNENDSLWHFPNLYLESPYLK